MKLQSDFLARAFHWSDEVIDAAQSPAAKLASTLLPILAPIIPAFITSIKLHALYTQLIAGRFPDWVATFGAVITAIVLEFLGWVGTIALVRNLYKWVKTRVDEYLVPTGLSTLAYIIYLADMWMVNSPSTNPDNVILLLALFSIPAGFLFAVTLVTGEDAKEEKEIRQEQREERLERLRIKHGGARSYAADTPQARLPKSDWRQLDAQERHEVIHVLSVPEIMSKYSISRSTAFSWKSKKSE